MPLAALVAVLVAGYAALVLVVIAREPRGSRDGRYSGRGRPPLQRGLDRQSRERAIQPPSPPPIGPQPDVTPTEGDGNGYRQEPAELDTPGTAARPPPTDAPAAGSPPRPRLDLGEITRRYQAGETITEIARAVGASPSGVSRAIKRGGVERRPPDGDVPHAPSTP
jgi:hypothetical protein